MNFSILTDIEGTTSSLRFVKEVLFPYAREKLRPFLRDHARHPVVIEAIRDIENQMGGPLSILECSNILESWIDQDVKATSLKAIQGLIWEEGYTLGNFEGHIYPDAAISLRRWHQDGIPLYVFSSGSVQAQKLLFGHTSEGDLTSLFSAFFDTTTGPKLQATSYLEIARKIDRPPVEILFLSDIEGELDAALEAGLKTIQLVRDSASPASLRHPVASSFSEIDPATLFS